MDDREAVWQEHLTLFGDEYSAKYAVDQSLPPPSHENRWCLKGDPSCWLMAA